MQSEQLEDGPAQWLAERCELRVVSFESPEFDAAIKDADALIVRTYTQVNDDLLDKAPRLRVVARAGVALENIDLPACKARGLTVVHAPESNTRSVIEFVYALIFDALRKRVFLDEAPSPKRWHEVRNELVSPTQLTDLTVGILGCGRIGSGVARVAQAFEMNALYYDVTEIPPEKRWGAQPVASAEELFERSDIVTVHVDSRPGNKRFVNAELLSHLKDGALFLNTSRGFVVDGPALAEFMREHPSAQAIIDVHDPEPIEPSDPLFSVPNVHLTPHIASATVTAKTNMSWVVRDVWRVLSGEAPQFPASGF